MRLLARAPLTVDGRDYRPGDVFEVEGSLARDLVESGGAEVAQEVEAPKRKRTE